MSTWNLNHSWNQTWQKMTYYKGVAETFCNHFFLSICFIQTWGLLEKNVCILQLIMPDQHGMTQIPSCSGILWSCHSQNVLLPSVWCIGLISTFVPLHRPPLPIPDSLASQNYYSSWDSTCSPYELSERDILLDHFQGTYEHRQTEKETIKSF